MWIMTNYEPHFSNHIKIPEIEDKVEFNENGKANVTEQVADLLCSNVDHIEKCKSKEDENEEEDSETDSIETEETNNEEKET